MRKKICIVATVPYSLVLFMRELIAELSQYYDVTLICSGDGQELLGMLNERVKFVSVRIERKIAINIDIFSLFSLFRVFYRNKFDCVLSLTPKAALLAMTAAFISGISVRVHIFTGQVWIAKRGWMRRVLIWADKISASLATNLLADSHSQKTFLIAKKVVNKQKITVIGKGSISGVDTKRFKLNSPRRIVVRQQLGLREDDVVFLFLARLTIVKGVVDLANAFAGITSVMPKAHLIVVGPDEEKLTPILERIWVNCREKVHQISFTKAPEDYMSAADVFCLPSYLEGFSSATIQAAGVGLPAIVSRIYGLEDAVESGVTGIFHEVGKISQIQDAMQLLYADHNLRKKMGLAAHYRAHSEFSQDLIVQSMSQFFGEILFTREFH